MYDQDFIAANQSERADNIVKGTKKEQMETIRQQIRDFKQANQVDKIVVLWTANTERYASVSEGLNDTAENFLASIDKNEPEVRDPGTFSFACRPWPACDILPGEIILVWM